jgi:DNA-binding transcriptional MerR regulator
MLVNESTATTVSQGRDFYTTAQLAKRCNVSQRQIQYWCDARVLRPQMYGHTRLFSAEDLRQVLIIRELRARQVELDAIGRILSRLPKRAGFLLIAGEHSGYSSTPMRRRKFKYCPDEQHVLEFAASHAGPVQLIEIGGLQ